MSHETVYAIASGKGGVGKTTTTVNVGTALAGAGNTVAVVDADLGMANLAGLVSLSPDATTLHEVLAGEASVEEATYELADGIAAVPSGADLESYADVDATGLRDVVARLREEFDYVLLDVGAGVSHESVLPLGLADEVVLVTTPEPASVQDASKTADLTARAEGRVAGLVITRVRDDRNFDFEGIAERVGVPLLGTVPEDDAVRDSVYSGTPVVVDAPDSPAAAAYRRIAERLVGADGDDAASEAGTDAASSAESDAAAEPADSDAGDDDGVSTAVSGGEGDEGNETSDEATGTPDAATDAGKAGPGAADEETDTASSAESDATADSADNAAVDGEAGDAETTPTESDATTGSDAAVEADPTSATTDADSETVPDAETDSDTATDSAASPSADPADATGSATADASASEEGVTIPDAEEPDDGEDDADGVTISEAEAAEEDEDIDEDAIPFSDRESTPTGVGGEEEEDDDEDDDGGFFGRLLG